MAWRSDPSMSRRSSRACDARSWAAASLALPERGQPGAQEGAEQVVVAVPVRAVVERDDEQVGREQSVQERTRLVDRR